MQIPFFRYCINKDSGQALIWILLLLGLSSLAISAICRVALWKLDSTIALMNQRKILENWEMERTGVIKSAYPTSSFKRINIANNQLAIPIVSKKQTSIDSLRIPVFKLGDKDSPLFNWQSFLKSNHGDCVKLKDKVCEELSFHEGRSLYFGDLSIDSLELPEGPSIIIATGNIFIDSLRLGPRANVEIFSGFELTVGEIEGKTDSTLFLSSAHGRVRLKKTDFLDCLSLPQIKINSKYPAQMKNKVIQSVGCSAVELSQFWQNLRYLGDLGQKSLN